MAHEVKKELDSKKIEMTLNSRYIVDRGFLSTRTHLVKHLAQIT